MKNLTSKELTNIDSVACPVCQSKDWSEFVVIKEVPVICNQLLLTREDALSVPRGDIRLGFCSYCSHVFNSAFEPGKIEYSQTYENSLHFSPHFREYAKSLAKRLIENHGLYRKDIVEIGCGKGDFLSLLCELGENNGVGFDPSYDRNKDSNRLGGPFTVVSDIYSERYADYKADFICCRHVLEHIYSPRDFIKMIRRTVGNRLGTSIFFEVPNIMFTLEGLGIWDLIYEHCNYFSELSLRYLFNTCSFKEKDVKEVFGGQFLCIDALPVEERFHSQAKENDVKNIMDYVQTFSEKYYGKLEEWKSELENMANAGKRVVIWGAGSKGATFLNALGVRDEIEYVVDINPRKNNMYVAGTGHKIVQPEFLRNFRPHTVIIMNPNYVEEIDNMIKVMGLSSDLIPA
jgi:SAM-dependent methyltransferase